MILENILQIAKHNYHEFHYFEYIQQKWNVCNTETCTHVFMTALLITAKIWKQSKYSSIDEWLNKMWHGHIRNYYSAMEKEYDNTP